MGDVLIKNADIITMSDNTPDIGSGYLGISNDSIDYIGKNAPKVKYAKVIDARNGIVMPGLINGHTHSPMSVYRGYADDMSLFEWLQEHIWPAEKEFLTKNNTAPATELSIAEMIRSGTTTFNDMYFFSELTEKIAVSCGMRVFTGEAVIDTPVPVFKISEDHWKDRAENFSGGGLANISLVPHSPYACSKKLLKRIKDVSENTGTPVHIHIAETQNEADKIKELHGMSPVEYLDSIGFLNENIIAVHCVILSRGDIQILADRGVRVVHCPQSNLKLASGIARITDMKKAGIKTALGTDGQASNNTLDMFSEMKTAALLQKAVNRDPSLMSAKEVIKMATLSGAEVLGIDKITGSLELGKKADLIIIGTDSIHMTPMYDPYSHIVYAAKGSDVNTVIIDGRIVMQNRELLTIDEDILRSRISELSEKIKFFRNNKGAGK